MRRFRLIKLICLWSGLVWTGYCNYWRAYCVKVSQKYDVFFRGFTLRTISARLNLHMVFALPSGFEYRTFPSSIRRSNLFSPPTSMTAFRYETWSLSVRLKSD